MGNTGPFNEKFLRCMPKEERKPMGAGGMTRAEVDAVSNLNLEREMHSTFAQWLTLQGIAFNHDDPTRKRHGTPGWPDFDFAIAGQACAVEFKSPGGMLSDEQRDMLVAMQRNGWKYLLAYSAQEAIDWVIILRANSKLRSEPKSNNVES